jgi:hypothetical protein
MPGSDSNERGDISMTIQTKRFIDLTDILAVRFTCKNCGATMSLPITDSKLTNGAPASTLLNECPSCHERWAYLMSPAGGKNYAAAVIEATAALNRLRNLLHGDVAPLGFTLSVEIAPDVATDQRENMAR